MNDKLQGERELLSCPFCGGPANIKKLKVSDSFTAGCANMACPGFTPIYESNIEKAVEAWNTRAALASDAEPVAWIPLTQCLPDPSKHDRVLIYTEGIDFAGEQFFDVAADSLNECFYESPEEQPEVCRAATHWMARPFPTEAAQDAPTPDLELPGMWERSDFEGGLDVERGPDWKPDAQASDAEPKAWRYERKHWGDSDYTVNVYLESPPEANPGLASECVSITPLFDKTPSPAQIEAAALPTEEELLDFADAEELFLFADREDFLAIANGVLELITKKLRLIPTEVTEQVERDAKDAERLRGLIELCGYVRNGSDTVVSLYQDDATGDWIIATGVQGRRKTLGWARGPKEAIDAAIDSANREGK